MSVHVDAWLSAALNKPAFSVEVSEKFSADSAEQVQLRDILAEHAESFCFAKLPTDSLNAMRALNALGFYLVDTQLTLGLKASRVVQNQQGAGKSGWYVRLSKPEDEAPVIAIARKCFRYSRFHLDPAIPRSAADALKARWLQSYFRSARGEALLVATDAKEHVVGFLGIVGSQVDGRRSCIIDLMGVEPDLQQQGIGSRLVEGFLERCCERASVLQVGTQAANIPSLCLYQNYGFRVIKSAYVLHRHGMASTAPVEICESAASTQRSAS